ASRRIEREGFEISDVSCRADGTAVAPFNPIQTGAPRVRRSRIAITPAARPPRGQDREIARRGLRGNEHQGRQYGRTDQDRGDARDRGAGGEGGSVGAPPAASESRALQRRRAATRSLTQTEACVAGV